MSSSGERKLLGKIELSGALACLTGMHIGASKENMEIGALDAPVVRDPVSLEPYVPGSSLKGKLRSLLEKSDVNLSPNRPGGSGVMRHECDGAGEASSCPVCRIFGSTGSNGGDNFPSRLKVRDLKLVNREVLEHIETGLLYTEWKFENSIDRVTSAANPRNIERVPRGARFAFSMVYDVEETGRLRTDLENLQLAVRLLEDDHLGGHGSRGYGQVKLDFEVIEAGKLDFYRGVEGQTRRVDDIGKIGDLVAFFEGVHAQESGAEGE